MSITIRDVQECQILTALDEADGEMPQRDLCEVVGVGDSRVSEICSDLEDSGRIARTRQGSQKVVRVTGDSDGE